MNAVHFIYCKICMCRQYMVKVTESPSLDVYHCPGCGSHVEIKRPVPAGVKVNIDTESI